MRAERGDQHRNFGGDEGLIVLTRVLTLQHNSRLTFFGGVPERPKGSDCKSDGSAFGGSNPPPSTIVMVARPIKQAR